MASNNVYGATPASVAANQLANQDAFNAADLARISEAIEDAAADVNKVIANRFGIDPASITAGEYPIDWRHLTRMVEVGAAAYFLANVAGQQAYDQGRMEVFRQQIDFMRDQPQEWGFYNSQTSTANTAWSTATRGADTMKATRIRRMNAVDPALPGRRGF